jgi:hypothetical protein
MRLSEAANRVIELARKVHDYYATELAKRHPNYPLVGPDEETAPPPAEEKELRNFLSTLSAEMIYRLILIMYLGREYVGVDNLAGYYETMRSEFGGPEYAISEMMMNAAPLADDLQDGLDQLRKHGIDVDELPLKKARVRKR